MFYHVPGKFNSGAYDANRRAKRRRVRERIAHGTLVYCGGAPVAWCQYGPQEELPRIDRRRGYTSAFKGAWRITCLFVGKGHRRMGIARIAISESMRLMKKEGVESVEAYPVEGKLSASMLWSGTPELFEGLGFSRVSRLGKNSWIFCAML